MRVLSVLLAAPFVWAQTADRAEVMLEAARKIESLEGDLPGAIQQYRRILATFQNNRNISAQALLRIGLCQEKLGQEEARKAYEQILRDYSDQADILRQARQRLSVIQRASAGAGQTMVRMVYQGDAIDGFGTVSPDGRLIAYTYARNLVVRDLVSGQTRRLTNVSAGFEVRRPIFSRDGKQIAYSFQQGATTRTLRIVGVDGSGDRQLDLGESARILGAHDWSPDGRFVLALMQRTGDNARQLALVALAGGAPRVLTTLTEGSTPRQVRFSPDGRYIVYSARPESGGQSDIHILSLENGEIRPVAQSPANDEVLAWALDGRVVFVSDRRGVTDVWALAVVEGRVVGEPVLVRRDFAAEVWMGITRAGAFYYLVDTGANEVYTAGIDESGRLTTPPAPVAGAFSGINSYADWSPDGSRIAYWTRPAGKSPTLKIRVLATGEERAVPAVLRGWTSSMRWFPDGKSLLVEATEGTTADSATHLYRVDAATGAMAAFVGKNLGNDAAKNPTFLPDGRTLVFRARQGSYPDRGKLYAIDIETGAEREFFSAFQFGNWAISRSGRQLVFGITENGTDLLKLTPAAGGDPRTIFRTPAGDFIPKFASLAWSAGESAVLAARARMDSGHVNDLWRFPIDGTPPEKLFATGVIHDIRLHPDGRRLAVSAWRAEKQVWAIENFLK